DGVVRELHFPEGTTVDVGTSIIAVAVGDAAAAEPAQEAVEDTVAAPAATDTAEETKSEGRQPVLVGYGVSTSATRRRPRKGAPVPAQEAPAASAALQAEMNGHGPAAPVTRERPLAKPPVRKLAKDLGVDLATVAPTGPDGIITREDVHAAAAPAQVPEPATAPAAAAPAATPAAPSPSPAAVSYDTARETRVPVKGVRRATAAAMVGSA
ncbi:E3 binding domain-containing protein, partial [Streptomyces sp. MH13]|uniref:E3 binding domain-containing protein n=1 Tax=unclassified Streptomyces TaxID=2593676 RepID=UPI003CEAF120